MLRSADERPNDMVYLLMRASAGRWGGLLLNTSMWFGAGNYVQFARLGSLELKLNSLFTYRFMAYMQLRI